MADLAPDRAAARDRGGGNPAKRARSLRTILMSGLPLDTWLRPIVWMATGFAIHSFYGRKHAVLRRRDGTAA